MFFLFGAYNSVEWLASLLCPFDVTDWMKTIALCAAETVIYRIFYYMNRSGTGHLTLRELKRGNLIAAMHHADEEDDINKVLRLVCREI